ncbi:hypothetical protein ACIBL3_26460 [Kribbella sp. NPDC050124]|uniref:hypothetical protein n=1 Tax=Kribbella sp. NPDC050124 TaxID=3364114 RepID=UPI0037AB9FD3
MFSPRSIDCGRGIRSCHGQLVVEIHVPLIATGAPIGSTWPRSSAIVPDDVDCPWIFEVDEYLAERSEKEQFEVFDDGEEFGDAYLYFITGAGEAGELGTGRRVPLT